MTDLCRTNGLFAHSVRPMPGLLVALSLALLSGCAGAVESTGDATARDEREQDESEAEPGSGKSPTTKPGDAGVESSADAELPIAPSLRIEPATAELVVVASDTQAQQAFVAQLAPAGSEVAVRWRVEGDLLRVDEQGVVSTRGLVGGTATLTAYYGDLTAKATIKVRVELTDEASAAQVPSGQRTALDGTPNPDPGLSTQPANPTKILYPYDGTVMPRGLIAPLIQFSPGSLPPQDIKLSVQTDDFVWHGYSHITSAATPRVQVPQEIWEAALATAKGQRVRLSIVKAVGGAAYGPAEIGITAADGTLKGAVYYMTYDSSALGLWSVRPGDAQPPKHIVTGCVVCHSASSNGKRLSAGADLASVAAKSGVYTIGTDGEATQVTGAPAGFGGDSRALSFATFTPDGRYVMRSANNFWGGPNQRAFLIDDAKKALVEAKVVGLGAQVSAYLPTFSHDGKQYAFTNGAGETAPVGATARSLSVMDVSIDEGAGTGGTLSFANRKVVLDNGASGAVVKFATFMPDANQLAFQEGEGYYKAYNEMLPTWGADGTFRTSTGRLAMVHVDSKAYTRLDRLNRGQVDADSQRNYEPFALPVSAGGYFWVVFTSIREYGNTYTGSQVRKQLWVAAISPNAAPGQDPSHPPFYLPNQGKSPNERGFWALEPCRSDGTSCASGDECCGGFCRAADAQKPELGNVCMPPDDIACADLHERCAAAADCCDAAEGAQCIGGYCDIPAPPPPMCRERGAGCNLDIDCCEHQSGTTCVAGQCQARLVF